MRKLIIRLGVVLGCLVILIGLAVIHVRTVNAEAVRSGQTYAAAAARDIASTWDPNALFTRAAPELKSTLDPQDLAQNFGRMSVFGRLTALGPCVGTASTTLTLTLSERTRADFRCPASFEHGAGSLALSLLPAGTEWRIRYFEFAPAVPNQ